MAWYFGTVLRLIVPIPAILFFGLSGVGSGEHEESDPELDTLVRRAAAGGALGGGGPRVPTIVGMVW